MTASLALHDARLRWPRRLTLQRRHFEPIAHPARSIARNNTRFCDNVALRGIPLLLALCYTATNTTDEHTGVVQVCDISPTVDPHLANHISARLINSGQSTLIQDHSARRHRLSSRNVDIACN